MAAAVIAPLAGDGEASHRAYTWIFRASLCVNLVDSSPYSTFNALLDSRKERQEECLGVAEIITFTCLEFSATEPRTISVEGFVHGNREIGESSLKQWLPMTHIPDLKTIEFVAVSPGRKQLDPRYRNHPEIRQFLEKTSLEPSVDSKPLRFDFYGSSVQPERPHHEQSRTWWVYLRVHMQDNKNFRNLLEDEKNVERHPSSRCR